MLTTLVIPARYASTRLPGKPLAMISGQTMLQRVVRLSFAAAEGLKNVSVIVATDDERIVQHCKEIGVRSVMTAPEAPSGTDRVAEAVSQMASKPDFILNMQGDAPLTPPNFLRAMIDSFAASPCDSVTPVTQLTWNQLDDLRQNKLTTPFSGTCAVFDEKTGNAFWFSKNIIPALRKEKELRKKNDKSQSIKVYEIFNHNSPAETQLKQNSAAIFATALKHYESQRFDKASTLFEQILSNNPNDSSANYFFQLCQEKIK